MINKKNLLGKQPFELGVKDAIHTAIVSVRAGAGCCPEYEYPNNLFKFEPLAV